MGKKVYRFRPKQKISPQTEPHDDINNKKIKVNISKSLAREINFTLVFAFLICVFLLASSYSIFSVKNKSKDYNSITVGTLKIDFLQDTINVLNLNGAYPTSDEDGQKEEPYTFKITNSGSLNASYSIKILNDNDMIAADGCQNNLLDDSLIKVSINNGTPFLLSSIKDNDYVIENGIIEANVTKNYEIRIWIVDTAGNAVLGRHYHGKIIVDGVNLNT